jgi:hypothetical protein
MAEAIVEVLIGKLGVALAKQAIAYMVHPCFARKLLLSRVSLVRSTKPRRS